jgi:hypothetical protein
MIIRSLLRAQAPKIAGRRTFRIPTRTLRTTRRYSTSHSEMASPVPQSQASMLATITTDLDKIAPRFEMQPEQIEILQTPAEFYQTLKVGRSLLLSILSSPYISLSLFLSCFSNPSILHISFQIAVLLYHSAPLPRATFCAQIYILHYTVYEDSRSTACLR